ncbi:uncharacterized protein FIBRA_03755 [Fibroporia radiculosa]|uniref:DUF6593 domain-containing protein n=1 Tax=Fibroporia radiculosa TaxID=599839 RepID=J4I9S9_9APHY|nr:uncharacterized protein FIBRA_03755 [Fibroporia radiculosa]CCM01691.1 predicted protein [Fibroporia radiculosa]
MASGDLTFRFIFPQNSDADMRTFQIRQVIEGSLDTAEIYKFHHPNTGTNMGVTTIQRKNAATQRWENAGQIEWSSDTNASVFFGGIERVSMRDLRKLKKPTSKSRRFKANGAEYKWKIAENGVDINSRQAGGQLVPSDINLTSNRAGRRNLGQGGRYVFLESVDETTEHVVNDPRHPVTIVSCMSILTNITVSFTVNDNVGDMQSRSMLETTPAASRNISQLRRQHDDGKYILLNNARLVPQSGQFDSRGQIK